MKSEDVEVDVNYTKLKLLLCLVTALWAGAAAVLYFHYRAKIAQAGQFGDAFGALNSLFAGLGFAVLIYTIYQQKQELSLQRLDLQETRAELRSQREYLGKQNQMLAHQQFDTTFFSMVDLHHSIVAAIEMRSATDNTSLAGRAALSNLGDFLRRRSNEEDFGPTPEDNIKGAVDFYLANYYDRQDALAHYFRNLYRIFKFVDGSKDVDKRNYTGLLRAQLSSPELVLLFFNCLSPLGKEKFKPLVEKYALFEHIPSDEPFLRKFAYLYSQKAFGTRDS